MPTPGSPLQTSALAGAREHADELGLGAYFDHRVKHYVSRGYPLDLALDLAEHDVEQTDEYRRVDERVRTIVRPALQLARARRNPCAGRQRTPRPRGRRRRVRHGARRSAGARSGNDPGDPEPASRSRGAA